jgi:hypothetical protein
VEYSKIKVSVLLEKLKANREAHKAEYEEAHATWKKKATKALAKAAKQAEEKGVITIMPLSDLPKPSHYLASYDSVIARLEMEVEDTVEVDEREFEAWVQNNWSWRGAFMAGTSLYNAA